MSGLTRLTAQLVELFRGAVTFEGLSCSKQAMRGGYVLTGIGMLIDNITVMMKAQPSHTV